MRGSAFFGRNAPNPQATDASIGKNEESNAGRGGQQELFFENVQRMRAQGGAAENFDGVFRFVFAALRKISLKVQRIDFEALDDAVGCQIDDTPVIMFTAAAARFPSVVHSRRAA